MQRKAIWMSGALIALMGTAGIAFAHDRGFGERGARGPMMPEMFGQIDADGDGKVTREEVEAFRAARFEAADTDGDGKLSQEEMAAARDARRVARMQTMVDRLDQDGDGFLSAEELSADRGRRGSGNMFDRLDADGDGALTLEDMQQARTGHRGQGDKMRFGGQGRHGGEYGHRGGHHGQRDGQGGMGLPFFGAPDTSDDG